MFDPRNMWIGMALCVALFVAYQSFQPTKRVGGEPIAYLRTTVGSETKVTKVYQADCLATKNRLWAKAGDEAQCLAYITPVTQPEGSTAVVFFHGDFPREDMNQKSMLASAHGYLSRATRIAGAYKIPVFVVARPGVMGSTGFHVIGGIRREHEFIASAIEGLKQRYGLRKLVLGGQSGGARLAAQMLASGRSDIACAVMASGAYDIPTRKGGGRMSTNIWGEPSRSYLIPLRSVSEIVQDGARRTFVVGDPRDKRTPFPEQRKWANALQQAGHHAVLLSAEGRGKEFHGLSSLAIRIAGMCATGKDDRAISNVARKAKS